jgi:hypothetical protein
MELHEALTQITEIRQQVARSEVFRGYRAVPVALSGVLAICAALVQAAWLPDAMDSIAAYLFLWLGTAVLSMIATGVEMALHCRHTGSSLDRAKAWLAVGQFSPAVVAGGLLTLVLAVQAPESLWMLPGLWAMVFSLGIFASYRFLPRATFFVAVFYMFAGVVCLVLARGPWTLSPWAMGLTFGCGQLLAAAILYWTLERENGQE